VDEHLHQGKGGKIQTIVRFSVQTLIILNLVSWNGLHRSNIFKKWLYVENTLWETITFVWEIIMYRILVNFMLPSSGDTLQDHLSLYTYC